MEHYSIPFNLILNVNEKIGNIAKVVLITGAYINFEIYVVWKWGKTHENP